MRQGKLSELIHNSAEWPDLDECSVEVQFKEILDMVHSFHILRMKVTYMLMKQLSLDQMSTKLSLGPN